MISIGTSPILSLVTFLPLVGVLFIMFSAGRFRAAGGMRAGSHLFVTTFTFALSLAHLDQL